jgi:quercetin dioxygenase-like cupin family protein
MLRYISLAVAVAMLGVAGSLDAQQQTTPPPLPAIKRTPLQKVEVPGTNHEVVLAVAEFVADAKVLRHSHPGAVLGYVLEGEFMLAPDGQAERTYQAGESFQVPNAVIHREGTGGKPAKLMVVYVVEKGRPLVQPQ